MNTKHTPALLTARAENLGTDKIARHIYTTGGVLLATCPANNPAEYVEADTRRFVACWNACEGIPTEVLESTGLPLYMHRGLQAQRDELLVALKDAADALLIHAPESWVLIQARAAIATCKPTPTAQPSGMTMTIPLPDEAIGAMVSRNGGPAKFYPVPHHLPADVEATCTLCEGPVHRIANNPMRIKCDDCGHTWPIEKSEP